MSDMSDIIVTLNDVRNCGYCINGVKDYCKVNNINFKDFLKNGISANDLPKDDIISKNIIDKAKQRLKREV